MINYRKGKERYKPNELGSLYVDRDTLDSNKKPIIYIGGQMGHHGHVLEQTGLTFDKGHNMFNGSWFYDYPVTGKAKQSYNAENFTKNLIESLKQANLHDVILITESFGGIIASYATQSELVSSAIAIHSPILGTPLANPSYIEKYSKTLTRYQKLLLQVIKQIVNTQYGFQQDNFEGIDFRKVDLNKLLVVGSYLDMDKEKNPLLRQTYEMILNLTSYRSDGVVIYEPERLSELGINHFTEEHNVNHFQANTKEHIEYVYKKTIH